MHYDSNMLSFRLQNYYKLIKCANNLDKKCKFARIFIVFDLNSCQLQDTATVISTGEEVPRMALRV